MSVPINTPINLVEDIAENMLASVMQKLGVEDTPENRADIMALALNALPTKYITSGGGRVHTSVIDNWRHQYETDVLAHLTRAALKVKANPRAMRLADALAESDPQAEGGALAGGDAPACGCGCGGAGGPGGSAGDGSTEGKP